MHLHSDPNRTYDGPPSLKKKDDKLLAATLLRMRSATIQQKRLDTAYARAASRAAKKGRPPPRRDDLYYDHWGYPYLYTAPYMYPLWWTPGLYHGWTPGYVALCGSGAAGVCAAGTCGGSVAQGRCGGTGVRFVFSPPLPLLDRLGEQRFREDCANQICGGRVVVRVLRAEGV